ncbi:MAG TPA: L-threonylcarbamoyladenylate synthase [Opitutales bacterium]|nr:L-threonylcarbamoyladenylate synthase [Opitutales bacterium]
MPDLCPTDEPPAILPPNAEGVGRAAELLRAGEVVALPTETVYGLAAHALDERAVRYVFAIKGRPLIDPLIVHGLDLDFFAPLAHFTPLARKLAESCWPGPLTLVVRKTSAVPLLVTAGRDTVALRAPAHPLMRAVIERCRLPLAAPSANPFGYLSPTRAEHVRDSFGGRVPWILDGGACALGLESTILEVSNPTAAPRILRPGPITAQALSQILGVAVETEPPAPVASDAGLVAPGMLARHYSPRTPLELLEAGRTPESPPTGRRAAWVKLKRPVSGEDATRGTEIFWLSEDGSLPVAARALYDLLRRLDGMGFEKIWCDRAPESGWGLALNDRLQRAAGRG